jgi:hypothetical protein
LNRLETTNIIVVCSESLTRLCSSIHALSRSVDQMPSGQGSSLELDGLYVLWQVVWGTGLV